MKNPFHNTIVRRIIKSIYLIMVPCLLIAVDSLLFHLGKFDDMTVIVIISVFNLLGIGTMWTVTQAIKERIIPSVEFTGWEPIIGIAAGIERGKLQFLLPGCLFTISYPKEIKKEVI